jgi:hypothetical protein
MQRDALFVTALVELTETVAAEGGQSALRAVDFEVLTTIGIRRHMSPLKLSAIGCQLSELRNALCAIEL